MGVEDDARVRGGRQECSSSLERVGRGFVDRVFRGWALQHPDVRLVPEGMNPAVEFMVRRGMPKGDGRGRQPGTPLILDEIQYVPELVPALKRWIDRDRRPGSYVLTGSQQWEVFRALSESLAGRVAFLDLEGFSLAEAALAIDEDDPASSWLEFWLEDPEALMDRKPARLEPSRPFAERLWRGSFPEVETLEEDLVPDFHAAYQRTYIERDARQLGEVSDWQLFGRFYRMAAALTAQEVNRSHLGRELGLSPQTAQRWIDMLVATFQWHEVEPFRGNTLKRIAKRRKGYLADTGSVCAALRIPPLAGLPRPPSQGMGGGRNDPRGSGAGPRPLPDVGLQVRAGRAPGRLRRAVEPRKGSAEGAPWTSSCAAPCGGSSCARSSGSTGVGLLSPASRMARPAPSIRSSASGRCSIGTTTHDTWLSKCP